jgi:hypothetical protein
MSRVLEAEIQNLHRLLFQVKVCTMDPAGSDDMAEVHRVAAIPLADVPDAVNSKICGLECRIAQLEEAALLLLIALRQRGAVPEVVELFETLLATDNARLKASLADVKAGRVKSIDEVIASFKQMMEFEPGD